MELFKFQDIGVDFLAKRNYALLADEQGLGKSAQAIVASKVINAKKTLIICPASVKYNWRREIDLWQGTQDNYEVINYDLIHRAKFAKDLLKNQYDLLICDEAHYIKNSRSKRSKMVLNAKGLANKAARVWLLTGTPVLNRPVEIFPMLRRFIPGRLGKYADYINFTKRYCSGHRGKFGWDDTGASHVDELAQVLDGFMLRRLKKDVMAELPDKIFQKIIFDPPKTVKGKLDKERSAYDENQLLGAIATIRREIGEAKIPQMVEHIKNLMDEKEKIVIFAYHRSVISALEKALGEYGVVTLTGGLTAEKKQKAVDDFVTRVTKRIFLGQIEAAGTGIDGLQKVADTVVFAEITWVPGQIKQAMDRCHRIGQKNKVLVQFLVMKGGIDEDIFDSIEDKTKVIKRLVDVPGKNIVFDLGLPVTKREGIKMATLEQNIERIANALEKIAVMRANTIETTVSMPALIVPEPVKAKKSPKVAAIEEGPVAPVAEKPSSEFKTTKEFLAYCNSKIIGIQDKAVAREKVAEVMVGINKAFGVKTIAQLNIENVPEAKEIFDTIIAV